MHRASQARHHLNVQCRLSNCLCWGAIDISHIQLALEVNAIKVILDIILIKRIDLDQVYCHVFAVPPMIPELIVAIGMSHFLWQQSLA